MKLKNWINELNQETEQAIKVGSLKIIYSEKDKTEYLIENYKTKEGMIKEFQ